MRKILGLLAFMVASTSLVHGIPPKMSPKAEVTGIVVDYERATGIIVLREHRGVDRKQRDALVKLGRPRTKKWLNTVAARYGVVKIDKDDVKTVRKGMRIKITDYQYGVVYGRDAGLVVSYSAFEHGDRRSSHP